MPKSDRTPEEYPPDELVLAAIDRASRHRAAPRDPGETLAEIKRHLNLPHHSGTTRRLLPQLEALKAAGLTERTRRHSRDLWLLTDTGDQRLEALRRAGELGSLPEPPQHRAWREAQVAASERIAGFRGELRGALDQAIRLLEADHGSDSNTWFELSEHLRHAGRLYASAIHCLREWPEPDDSQADTDDPPYGQRGRRQIRGWDSEFPY